eukprot:7314568-Prymnesium_polylepis.1
MLCTHGAVDRLRARKSHSPPEATRRRLGSSQAASTPAGRALARNDPAVKQARQVCAHMLRRITQQRAGPTMGCSPHDRSPRARRSRSPDRPQRAVTSRRGPAGDQRAHMQPWQSHSPGAAPRR